MLKKFPAFNDEIDLDTDDDIRKKMFEEFDLDEACDGLDYADDIEPWLGDRAAVAAVDNGGDTPDAAFVLQVKDEDAAEDGLAKIKDCAGERASDGGGWVDRRRVGRDRRDRQDRPGHRRRRGRVAARPTTRTTRSGPTRSVTPASSTCTPLPQAGKFLADSARQPVRHGTGRRRHGLLELRRRPRGRPQRRRPLRRGRGHDRRLRVHVGDAGGVHQGARGLPGRRADRALRRRRARDGDGRRLRAHREEPADHRQGRRRARHPARGHRRRDRRRAARGLVLHDPRPDVEPTPAAR